MSFLKSASQCPLLVVFCGPPGTGKSTLSYALSKKYRFSLITKDLIDRSLQKVQVKNPRASYEILLDLAKANLAQGVSVVLEACFTYHTLREQAVAHATITGSRWHIINCFCSDDAVWKSRFVTRKEVVEGWKLATYEKACEVKKKFEPITHLKLDVDTVRPLDECMKMIENYISI